MKGKSIMLSGRGTRALVDRGLAALGAWRSDERGSAAQPERQQPGELCRNVVATLTIAQAVPDNADAKYAEVRWMGRQLPTRHGTCRGQAAASHNQKGKAINLAALLESLTHYCYLNFLAGEVPEWTNGAVSKTVVPLRVPRVRIPVSPPGSLPAEAPIPISATP